MRIKNSLILFLLLAVPGILYGQNISTNNNTNLVLPQDDKNEVFGASYDKFRDITSVLGVFHLLDCKGLSDPVGHFDISAGFEFTGTTPKTPAEVGLIILSGSHTFERAPDLFIIADGKRFALGKVAMDTQSETVGRLTLYYQLGSITMPYETFREIANSKAIEMKLGDVEFAEPWIELAKVQELLQLFKKLLAMMHQGTTIFNSEPLRVANLLAVSTKTIPQIL